MNRYYLWTQDGGMLCFDADAGSPEFVAKCESLRLRSLMQWHDADSGMTFVKCVGVV